MRLKHFARLQSSSYVEFCTCKEVAGCFTCCRSLFHLQIIKVSSGGQKVISRLVTWIIFDSAGHFQFPDARFFRLVWARCTVVGTCSLLTALSLSCAIFTSALQPYEFVATVSCFRLHAHLMCSSTRMEIH